MDELKPFDADLRLSKRWFEQARECALAGHRQSADICLDRGLAILDRIEKQMEVRDAEEA